MQQKQRRLGPVIIGVLLGILVSAMDNTIVATAMGTIVAELGGLNQFVWVTAAYMVTEMAGMPIFGKLSDMYGRKRFFLFGLIVFLIGSILCGTSQGIPQLILYRAIQGIGGGALAPSAFTVLFDVTPPERRGTMGGMFGAVFGLSSIFGPLLGAYLTQYLHWRWVFYVNLPIGALAFVLVAFFYKESLVRVREGIDWLGVCTLVPAIAALMLGLQLGGTEYPWISAPIGTLFAGAAVLFAAFLIWEARAPEPIISYEMFRVRLFAVSSIVGLFMGVAFIVPVMYIPIYIQGVFGGTATNSGLTLLPMMVGSVAASQMGVALARKMSYRAVLGLAGLVLTVGIGLLGTLTPTTGRWIVILYMIVVGLGTGPFFSVLGITVMQPFSPRQRGVAGSTSTFLRQLGMTVGIAIYGIVQRNLMHGEMVKSFAGLGQLPAGLNIQDPHTILSPVFRAHLPGAILAKVTAALSLSVAHTFAWALIPALLSLALVVLMGPERMDLRRMGESPVQPGT